MDPVPIRKLKKIVLELLRRPDFDAALEEILALPPRRAVNPLFSFLFDRELLVRWRAVTALGALTSALADKEMESARVVFRRLMWNLNDESGGIGWGSPEVMGEIVARHPKMRAEYLPILGSYLRPECNFLEHEGLQQGVLWAVGRVAREDPASVRDAAPYVRPYLSSENRQLRGISAWCSGRLGDPGAAALLKALENDPAQFSLWDHHRLSTTTVGRSARDALARIFDRS